MFLSTLVLSSVLSSVGVAIASSTGGSLAAREPAVSVLQLRQTSAFDPNQIPPQCKSACATAVGILNNPACATPDCICTADVNAGLLSCLDCWIATEGASATAFEISQAQSSLRGFEDGCNALGITVTSLSIDPKAASSPLLEPLQPEKQLLL